MESDRILSTSQCEQEDFWEDLLAFIADRRVIPVIGPELLSVTESGEKISLYRALAEGLVKKYGLSYSINDEAESCLSGAIAHLKPQRELNDAVCALAMAMKVKSIQDLYRPINDLLKELVDRILADSQNEGLIPLRQLAAIGHFDLFVTTTFDDLLARMLDRERFDGQAKTVQVPFAPNLPSDKRGDIPESRKAGDTAVFYLFGKSSPSPTYAIHDEDILEFVYNLQVGHINVPQRFLSEIRNKNLLLIGCNFADWLSRFFLRLSNPGRLFDLRAKREFLVGSGASADRSFTIFLERFSQNTRIYPHDACQFVSELSRRWHERPDTAAPPEGAESSLLCQPKRPGGIFISYASENLPAALKLSEGLKELGGDLIWFDKSNLRPGDEWDLAIRAAIRCCDLFLPIISEITELRSEGYFRREWRWANDRAEGIQGKKFIMPIVIDPNYDGNPEKYRKMPEGFKKFQFGHAPSGEMAKGLKEELKAEIRDLRRERTP